MIVSLFDSLLPSQRLCIVLQRGLDDFAILGDIVLLQRIYFLGFQQFP